MKLQVLVSCMSNDVSGLLKQLNLQSNAVIVNQCDCECEQIIEFQGSNGQLCEARIINTRERGLSKSRNMAIKNSTADICLLCDDDEVLIDGYENIILDSYENNSRADVILYDVIYSESSKRLSAPSGKMSFRSILSSHSVQISFKRQRVMESGVVFDAKMGAGTGNGAGEEIKFLYDLYKKKRELFSDNIVIAKLKPSVSTWFAGCDSTYICNLGWSTRRWAGPILGYCYLWYFVFFHRYEYSGKCSTWDVITNLHKGYFEKR